MSSRWIIVLLYIVLIGPVSARMFVPSKDHPAYKLFSYQNLLDIKVEHSSRLLLSNAGGELSIDQLNQVEINPADDVVLAGTTSLYLSELRPSNRKEFSLSSSINDYPDPQIVIDGTNYSLSVLEVVEYEKQSVTYVSAKIIDHTGYARFVIDGVSAITVGHLEIAGQIYRVLPRETNPSQQLIYRVESAGRKQQRLAHLRLISQAGESPVGQLEAELIKTELLLDMVPDYYSQYQKNHISHLAIEAKNIGYIDIAQLSKGAASPQISAFLADLNIFTDSGPDYSFFITKVEKSENDRIKVSVKQLFEKGYFDYSSVLTVKKDGTVTKLYSTVVDFTSEKFVRPRLTKEDFMAIAREKVEKNHETDELPVSKRPELPPFLVYVFEYKEYLARPIWMTIISGTVKGSIWKENYFIILDDQSGELILHKGTTEIPYFLQ